MKYATAFSIVLAFAVGCSDNRFGPDDSDKPYIQGRVTEAAPTETVVLPGVTVRIAGTSAVGTSSPAGDFLLPHVPASGTVEASAAGYETATTPYVAGQFLFFRLKPAFAMLTDTVTPSPAELQCIEPDDFYRGFCRSIRVHHAGPFDIGVTWKGDAEFLLEWTSRPTPAWNFVKGTSGSLNGSFESVAGSTYDVWVFQTRGPETPFTLTTTHPN